jgi:hypothetical protein
MLTRFAKPISLLVCAPLSVLFGALRLAEKPARARRQRPKARAADPRVSFGVYAKVAETDLSQDDVNHWLARQELPRADRWRGGGGGGLVTVGRVVIDGQGSGGGADEYESTSHTIAASGGQGGMQIGVLVIDTPFARVYPLAGFGGTGGGVRLAPLASTNGSEPRDSGWFAMVLNGGIGVDFRLPLWWLSVWIGLRVGYQLPAFTVQFGEGADVSVRARPFFRVLIGTGLTPPTTR